jgi:hypothetical protein
MFARPSIHPLISILFLHGKQVLKINTTSYVIDSEQLVLSLIVYAFANVYRILRQILSNFIKLELIPNNKLLLPYQQCNLNKTRHVAQITLNCMYLYTNKRLFKFYGKSIEIL